LLKEDLKKGTKISLTQLYSAIPYQKEIGQISSRDFIEDDAIAIKDLQKNKPLLKSDIG